MRLGSRFWLSRSLPVLVVGLVVLALGLFVEWPPPIGYLVGLAGVLIVVAWALGFPRGRARERREKVDRRMATAERRQHVIEAEAERRAGHERRAYR
jgi:hypothetical protein